MGNLRVLVACEFSGTVRDAFLREGYDAWSCDLRADERGSNRHIRDDVRNHLEPGMWDLMAVMHPPCTRLCNSGSKHLAGQVAPKDVPAHTDEERAEYAALTTDKERFAWLWQKLDEHAELFSDLWNAPIPCIAAENPIMHKHAKARIRNYKNFAQTFQPWQFGDKCFKRTCLWLNNLAPLEDTNRLTPPVKGSDEWRAWNKIHYASPGEDRSKERARFFPGVAEAMAKQWGPQALQYLKEAA